MKKRLLSIGILLALVLALAVYAGNQADEIEQPAAPAEVGIAAEEVTAEETVPVLKTEAAEEPAVIVKEEPPTMAERLAERKEWMFNGDGITDLDFSPEAVMWRFIDQIRSFAEVQLWYAEKGANFSEEQLRCAREMIELSKELHEMYSSGAEIDEVLLYHMVQNDSIHGLE